MRIKYDYSKLCGRIVEKYGSRKAFAKEIGMSEPSLSQRLNNCLDFSQSEILRASIALELPEIDSYFFTRYGG